MIAVTSPITLQVKDFATEVFWDTLVVNGNNYSGSSGPVGVEADGEISWSSDGASEGKGWSILRRNAHGNSNSSADADAI